MFFANRLPGRFRLGTALIVWLGLGLLLWEGGWLPRPLQGIAEVQAAPGQVEIVLDADPKVTLWADDIIVDQDKGSVDFVGRVELTRGEDQISASRGRWHEDTQTVELDGEVVMTSPELIVRAERLTLNLEHNLARIYNGQAFFHRQNYYLSGEFMERRGAETVYLRQGRVTTCDGPSPAWSVNVKDLTVTRAGYATGSSATFNTKYFPAFYLPFVALPVKTERQSGFLMPMVSQSTRDGQVIGWPVFWATGENHDLTLTPVWRSKRGLSMTLEANHQGLSSESSWLFTRLSDHKPQNYTYDRNGRDESFNNRWWLRGKNDLSAYGWDFMLDVDLASDPLYLEAFDGDPDGFNYSERLMRSAFGRGFNEAKDPLRKSVALARRTHDDSLLNLELQYNHDVSEPNNEDALQRYPSILYSLASRPAGRDGQWGFFSFTGQYDYFYRKYDQDSLTSERGQRLHLAPEFYKPFNLGDWASLTTKAALRETMYLPRGYASNALGAQGMGYKHGHTAQNTGLDFDLGLSTTLSRIYRHPFWDAEAFRHQVTPALKFAYNQNHYSNQLPFWDELDFTPNRRTLSYGFTSSLMAKVPQGGSSGNSENNGAGPLEPYFDYQEWVRLGVWSSYEFSHEEKLIGWPYAADYYGHGQGPLELDLELNPSRHVRIQARSAYDYKKNAFVNHDFKGTLYNTRGDSLSVGYEQARGGYQDLPSSTFKANEELRLDLALKLNEEWSANFDTRYDIYNSRELETNYRLRYKSQCWGVTVIYSETFDDSRVMVAFDLLGLGSMGQGNN